MRSLSGSVGLRGLPHVGLLHEYSIGARLRASFLIKDYLRFFLVEPREQLQGTVTVSFELDIKAFVYTKDRICFEQLSVCHHSSAELFKIKHSAS